MWEGEELIETGRAWSDQGCRIQDNVVGDAKIVGVGNEAAVRSIVRQSRAEIEGDKTEVIPSFAPGIVDNDEGAAWSNWVRDKVVGFAGNTMVGRDSGQIVVGAQ